MTVYIGRRIENIAKGRDRADEPTIQRFTVEQVAVFRSMFSFLNPKDRDILYLIFVAGKRQKDVQRILGRSQPSLCYDIKRIRNRLRFIFYLHSVWDIFVDFLEGKGRGLSDLERRVLTYMFYTSSFSETARLIGQQQVTIRHTYDRCLRKLEQRQWWAPYEIFMVIRSNLNMVRRTYGDDDSVSLGLARF